MLLLINYNQEQTNSVAESRYHLQPLYPATSSMPALPLLWMAAKTLVCYSQENYLLEWVQSVEYSKHLSWRWGHAIWWKEKGAYRHIFSFVAWLAAICRVKQLYFDRFGYKESWEKKVLQAIFVFLYLNIGGKLGSSST